MFAQSRPASDDSASNEIPDTIPVFPLPGVVFFPKTYLPLHIFEPRYREMVRDLGDGPHYIGMALLKEGWEQDYARNPPVYHIGCVGKMVTMEPLNDGRYNIVLEGLHRYRILDESHTRSYRMARIELVLSPGSERLSDGVRDELMMTLRAYIARRHAEHVWSRLCEGRPQDVVLINTLCSFLDLTPLEKQFLLEADSLTVRARRLSDLLDFKLHEFGGIQGWG